MVGLGPLGLIEVSIVERPGLLHKSNLAHHPGILPDCDTICSSGCAPEGSTHEGWPTAVG